MSDTEGTTETTAGSRLLGGRGSRRRVLLVSVAVAAVAGSVAAGTALAAGPALPAMNGQELLTRVLSSHVDTYSGRVQAQVDLGIPSQLLSALPSAAAGALGSGSTGSGSTGSDSGTKEGGNAQLKLAEQQLVALLAGTHSADIASDGPNLQSFSSADLGRTVKLVHNGSQAWAYDSQKNQAVHITDIRTDATDTGTAAPDASVQPNVTTPAQAAAMLQKIAPFSSISVDNTSMVAGRSAYVLVVAPKGHGSTIGEIRVAVDAKNFLPLEVKVTPSDGSSPIADVRFVDISFAKPAASTFEFQVPKGATVETKSAAEAGKQHARPQGKPAKPAKPAAPQLPDAARNDVTVLGTGWTTVVKVDPTALAKDAKSGQAGKNPLAELNAIKTFGQQVKGGTLFSTKLINVLITDNGTIYAGAVTPSYLESLAGQ